MKKGHIWVTIVELVSKQFMLKDINKNIEKMFEISFKLIRNQDGIKAW